MAADPCCDDIVGGEVYITMGDRRFEATADVVITPRRQEREAKLTNGGRLMVTERAVPYLAEITFVNQCGGDPLKLWDSRCHTDITVIEKSRGFRHLFSKASIVGNPKVNLSTGEVQGITVAADKYVRTQQ
jgi:hypothetical protein